MKQEFKENLSQLGMKSCFLVKFVRMKKCLLITLYLIFYGSFIIHGQEEICSEPPRKKVGVVLSGGGAKGFAHVGVLKMLEEVCIPIDYIAGSSTGALIGGLYSYFKDTDKIEEIVNSLTYRKLYQLLIEPGRRMGLIKGGKYVNFLESTVRGSKIQDLDIKFAAVSADLFSGKVVEIKKGIEYRNKSQFFNTLGVPSGQKKRPVFN